MFFPKGYLQNLENEMFPAPHWRAACRWHVAPIGEGLVTQSMNRLASPERGGASVGGGGVQNIHATLTPLPCPPLKGRAWVRDVPPFLRT